MIKTFSDTPAYVIILSMMVFTAMGVSAQSSTTPAEMYSCADLSFLDEVEQGGGIFTERGVADDAIELLSRHGLDLIRIRIWHSPGPGNDDLDDALELAQRAHAAGLGILVDLHYSDTWADPGQQAKPAAWQQLDFTALSDSVRQYTRDVLTAFVDQGTTPQFIQLGNEIISGFLWDDGRVGGAFDTEQQWDQLGDLLQAALDGVHLSSADSIQTIIHIDRGGDIDGATWFFDNLLAQNIVPDIIGLSFYPWWHGTKQDFETTLRSLEQQYSLPIFVVETAYPWTLAWFDNENNIVGTNDHLHAGYAATPDGQFNFIRDVVAIVNNVPNGRGIGTCYWAPDYITSPGKSSPWENMTLFDNNGEILPAAEALGNTTISSNDDKHLSEDALSVFPNPARDFLSVQGITARCSKAILSDMLGRVVASYRLSPGHSTAGISIRQVPSGTYVLRLESPTGSCGSTPLVVTK